MTENSGLEKDASKQYSETKFHILLGVYVGAWGIVPGLTPKLIPLDLEWIGLGVLAFSFGAFMHAITFPCTDTVAEVWGSARARLSGQPGPGSAVSPGRAEITEIER